MAASHYHLQYHLYSVALHRYLGLRLAGSYEHARHFGGVYYLFVRGMSPRYAPGNGIYYDRPSGALLDVLSAELTTPGAAALQSPTNHTAPTGPDREESP